MTEFTPAGGTPRMTKAQMRKYLADMKKVQEEAKKKLDPDKEQAEKYAELSEIEKQFDDIG